MADNTNNVTILSSTTSDVNNRHLKDNIAVIQQNKNTSTLSTTTKTPITPSINDSNSATTIQRSIISIDTCSTDHVGCFSILDILKLFNAAVSEEQAWALIYQSVFMYKDAYIQLESKCCDFVLPESIENLHIHKDGSMHVSVDDNGGGRQSQCVSQKKILLKLGCIVFGALDYNVPSDTELYLSPQLEQVIKIMTAQDDADDEGIGRDSDDIDDDKWRDTKELDQILDLCTPRVLPTKPNEHYKAVCRALAMECLELRVFLQKVLRGDTENLRLNADVQSSRQELQNLGFSDWARFWVQVVDELRRGVRLKKRDYPRAPLEFELTPYEILMEDIRTRKYNLRKVMVNGDIPPRVKKDAHAFILEFIRSRPPLRKASERKLPPPKWNPTPREQLLDSIRRGRVLKHIQPKNKSRLLPPQIDSIKKEDSHQYQRPKSRQRLIEVDLSLFADDDDLWDFSDSGSASLSTNTSQQSQQQHIINESVNDSVVYRRKTYDLATQCESRRASMRRHTIVGCQSNMDCQSTPSSRPDSRQSEEISTTATMNPLNPHNPMTSAILDEWTRDTTTSSTTGNNGTSSTFNDSGQWNESLDVSDRLALTLEEIVHIRSVMTKAELEGLPVGVQVKEDVERRKVCFLCLRTRFTFLGQWGVQCKLCKRTVCSKCHSKMRIPTEHFRNVPVVLLSPSLMNSPITSTAPSPSHHAHNLTSNSGPSSILDESFPKSLMERLLRSDSNAKTRKTIGSAPSSPKTHHSTSNTPLGINNVQNSANHQMTMSMGDNGITTAPSSSSIVTESVASSNRNSSIMSRSMEGPRSLPPQSPARPHSNNSTLDRRNRFARAFLSPASTELKEALRGEMMNVCNDCRGLVYEIIRSSKQTRSSARNKALKNLTLDLSPVYKRW